MAGYKPSLQDIEQALRERFNLPFVYDVPNDKEDINGFNFFTYMFDKITWEEACIWKQDLQIAYVSNQQTDLKEREIWETLKAAGLRVEPEVVYSRFYLSDKSVTVDVVTFKCSRIINFIGR